MSSSSSKPDVRRWILLALMCTLMLAAMDATIVSTAIPQIVGDLGGFSIFTWVFSIYLLAQTVTIPVYGKLADIFGRKPILIIGTVIFLAGSAASALSWNMLALIVFRGLQGLGAGSIMATVATLAGDLYSVKERAVIQGWLSSVWGMAAIVGPLLGGAFAEYISWRWIFLINVPVGIAAMILLSIFLHESFEKKYNPVDYQGAVLILISGGLLIFSLLQGGSAWPWLSWQSAVLVLATLFFITWLVRVEKRAQEPILPGWVWSRRVLGGANLATVGMGVVMMAAEVYLPTYAQSVLGLGAIGAGLVLASMSLGWPTASSLSGRIYLRIGFRQAALMGAGLIILATSVFAFGPETIPVWLTVADTICLGAGFGLLSTPLIVGVQSVVDWDRRGVVTGANMFSRYLGSSIGAALMGAVFNNTIRQKLLEAPGTISQGLPDDMNQIISLLQHNKLGSEAALYLREGISQATTHLYVTAFIVAIFLMIAVLVIPSRFSSTSGKLPI